MPSTALSSLPAGSMNSANAVSDARDKIDGSEDKNQGTQVEGRANIALSRRDAIAFITARRKIGGHFGPKTGYSSAHSIGASNGAVAGHITSRPIQSD